MTDTPSWSPPSSPEPQNEATGSSAPPPTPSATVTPPPGPVPPQAGAPAAGGFASPGSTPQAGAPAVPDYSWRGSAPAPTSSASPTGSSPQAAAPADSTAPADASPQAGTPATGGFASPGSSPQAGTPADSASPHSTSPQASTPAPGSIPPPYSYPLPHSHPGVPPQGGWGPQPGWGQAPAWGHGGWAAPPSPKPGVIPLRPLGLGEILDGAVSTVRAHWRTAFGLSLGVAVLVQTISALTQLWQYAQPDDTLAQVAYYLALPLASLIGIFAAGLLTIVVSKAVVGQPITIGEAWKGARPQLGRLVGLTVIVMLITLGVMLVGGLPLLLTVIAGDPGPGTIALLFLPVLAAAPVAIWLNVRLSLAAPALMLERQTVRAALARSRKLVNGAWWRILGITMLGQVLMFIVSMIIVTPFTLIAMAISISGSTGLFTPDSLISPATILLGALGGIISSTVTIPVTAALNALLYVDQRIRREALDLELARAAGLPGHADTPPGA
ncbi:hypothetical protein CFP65_2716 [Kitasatospora sp. MMS16-BH015]|uniref:hypothetical protein n=1 Tax=Kitasatospora sp. MMS16-BH015 TaxID=2018025 RepID=UPI000CA2D000|nr:hypothetical protein [Kitasatospora sp. MMS16-BH015]AUG77537.1 hypothetical protein CFP65_2716 [Kitasatospora sp. MMS16-BH015]